MAKPSLDDLIGSVRDPKKQARKDALANVPVNKTSAAQAAANTANINYNETSNEHCLPTGQCEMSHPH